LKAGFSFSLLGYKRLKFHIFGLCLFFKGHSGGAKFFFYGSSGKSANSPLPSPTYICSILVGLPVPSEATEVMHAKITENEWHTLQLLQGKSMACVIGTLHW
jgi:hypothetical protein